MINYFHIEPWPMPLVTVIAMSAPMALEAQAFSNRVQCEMRENGSEASYGLEYTIRTVRSGDTLVRKVRVKIDDTDPLPFDTAQSWEGRGAVLSVGLDAGPLLLTVSGNMEAMLIRTDIHTPTTSVDFGTCEVIE